jgi:exonuclease VII small subunit
MSAYELETVIQMWDLGQLTIEQAIGQILMLIKERDERLQELEGRVASLRRAQDETDH